jgi:hypothetical protein
MQSDQFVVRAPADDGGVVTRRVGGETLLVPVCGGVGDLDSVYTLNPIGTFIWDAIAQPVAVGRLAELVASEYEVDRERARDDVAQFLGDLSRLGLIRLTAGAERAAMTPTGNSR